jgi:hypothetical protein
LDTEKITGDYNKELNVLNSGQGMFLLVSNDSKNPKLAAGKVIESSSTAFAIELDDSSNLQPGLETLAYCDVRGKFFQQGVTLTEVRALLSTPTYVFVRVGEPVSAEQRQTFRVSVALSNVIAQVGERKQCQVVDVSPEGIAVITSQGFSIGTTVKIALAHEDNKIAADARIQTIKVLPTGKVRYGLLVPNTNPIARKALLKMSMGFQRTQLKRLAGAA